MGMNGSYMQVYSGHAFWPLDPRPEHVNIEDIAHALSNMCRFGGHTSEFYSVAQHSILVSQYLAKHKDPSLQLMGLLHDAGEAYVGDMVRPLKWNSQASVMGQEFDQIERHILQAILNKFGFVAGMNPDFEVRSIPEIKEADEAVLLAEARDFMGQPGWTKKYKLAPYPDSKIKALDPSAAKALFLGTFNKLMKRANQDT